MRLGGSENSLRSGRLSRWIARSAVASGLLLVVPAPAMAATQGAPAPQGGGFAVVRTADGGLEVVRQDASDRGAGDVKVAAEARGEVLSAESDSPVQSMGLAPDPMRGDQWALDKVSYERAWSTTAGSGVVVAVVDSGVLASHEDLGGVVLPGIDLVDGGDGRIDPNGHGTHVAGIIAARALNGRGVSGAAPAVKILPVRVLDANGAGYSSDVAEGIIWATNHGARIINLSLGGTIPSDGTREAIKYALSKGTVVFAAAGNSGQSGSPAIYPAAFPEPVAVAAVNSSLQRAPFSNVGGYVDVAAPGDSIVSTYKTGGWTYGWMSGSSMATPYAAAAGALVAAANPTWDAAKIRARLEGTVRDLGPAGTDAEFGRGLVDPAAAVYRRPVSNPRPGGGSGGGTQGKGYWVVGADGRVTTHGGARNYGDLAGRALSGPIVAATSTASGKGYWLAGADGSVYAFGDARFHGSMSGRALNAGIVGMAVTPDGGGYFLLGADGGVFSFGDARFKGSTGGIRLNAPVLDMTVTASGNGYWMVAADGGVFSFGDATFRGSTGGMRLSSPAASMTAADRGQGYWVVARDGGIFAFGVPFHGSLPGIGATGSPGVRIRSLPDGTGYYILTLDGDVYPFGKAKGFAASSGLSTGTVAVDLMLVP